jgi:hypothetical protein
MISDERADKAVEFIRDNAERHGQVKAAALFAEYKVKRARSQAFLDATGTVAEREAAAWIDPAVTAATEEHRDMVAEETMLRDLIEAADLTFKKWQTEQANSRRGP